MCNVCVLSLHITNRKPSWFECSYRSSSFMFFHTFEAFFFFDKILQSVYYAIAYCTLFLMCHWASSNHRRQKKKFYVPFQRQQCYFYLFFCSPSLSPEILIQEQENRHWLSDFFPARMWNYFFLLLCFIFILILIFFRSVSCIISYSFALVPIVSQQSQCIYSWYVLFCFCSFSTVSKNQKQPI